MLVSSVLGFLERHSRRYEGIDAVRFLLGYRTDLADHIDDDLLDRGLDGHPGNGQHGWYAAGHGYTAPGEMAVLRTLGSLLETHHLDSNGAGFVEPALRIYYEYTASECAWQDTLACVVSDYPWPHSWDEIHGQMRITQANPEWAKELQQ